MVAKSSHHGSKIYAILKIKFIELKNKFVCSKLLKAQIFVQNCFHINNCFHHYIYFRPMSFLWNLSTLCHHLLPLTLRSLLSLLRFFGSLVPAMCNRTWSAQVHEISESQCDDSQECTLLFQLLVYYVHLISVIQLSVILYKDFVMILVIFSREGKNLNHTSFMFIDFLFNFSFFSFFYFKGEILYNSFVTEDKM